MHIVPWVMIASSSLRCTMPMSKKPAYSLFISVFSGDLGAVAVVLRSLYERHFRIVEERHQIAEPVLLDDIVGIQNGDHRGVRRGVLERDVERARLEAGAGDIEELETIAEFAAAGRNGRRITGFRRVVDDDDRLEVRVVESRQTVQRLDHHLRRLAIGGDVDGHFRRRTVQRPDVPAR